MHKSVTLRLKSLDSIEAVLERIRQMPGVVKVEQMFPGETDLSLGGLFVLQVEEAVAKEVIQKLLQDPVTRWAYESTERK